MSDSNASGTAADVTSSFFELVAIDLDGTLVDSVADLHAAVVRMQDALSLPHATENATRDRVGNGIERLVHRSLTGTMEDDAPAALFESALEHFRTAYDAVNGTRSTLYPGVAAELARLAATRAPVVVVTNKAGRFSRPLLDALGIAPHIDHHVAGDDVAKKKPDPAALFEAARLANAPPARSVLVGDSINDVRAARNAGFASILVSYGYNHGVPVHALEGAERPDAVIDSFTELEHALARVAAARAAS